MIETLNPDRERPDVETTFSEDTQLGPLTLFAGWGRCELASRSLREAGEGEDVAASGVQMLSDSRHWSPDPSETRWTWACTDSASARRTRSPQSQAPPAEATPPRHPLSARHPSTSPLEFAGLPRRAVHIPVACDDRSIVSDEPDGRRPPLGGVDLYQEDAA